MNNTFRTLFIFIFPLFLLACSSQLSDVEHVERAQNLLDKKELRAASVELKNALQLNEGNVTARWLLGKVYLEIGAFASAEKELRKARELGLVDSSVLGPLAEALLGQGRNDALQALSPNGQLPKAEKANLLATQGLGLLSEKRVEAAREKINAAISVDPESIYARVSNARLLGAKREYKSARKELELALSADSDYAPAWSFLGDLENLDRQFEKAESAFGMAIKNRINSYSDRLKRALARIELEKLEEAQKDIDVVKASIPRFPGLRFAQGLIYLKKGLSQEAQDAFELEIKDNIRHPGAIYYLSLLNLQKGNLGQAESYGKQFLAIFPASVQGRKLVAEILLSKKEYKEVERMIRPVVEFKKDDLHSINILVSALVSQKKLGEAIGLLEKAVELESDSAMPHFRLGLVLLSAGEKESGIDHLRKAISLKPDFKQAHVLLVQKYMDLNETANALEAANHYRDLNPNIPDPYILIGIMHTVLGENAQAEQAYSAALKVSPADILSRFGLAKLATDKKDFDRARVLYQQVLQEKPGHLQALLRLATLDEIERNESAMLSHIQQAISAHPDSIQPRVMLANYYLRKGEPEKVPGLMADVAGEQKESPRVLLVLALSHLAQKQFSLARLNLQKVLAKRPDYPPAHLAMAHANAGLKDVRGSKTELERAVELAPNYLLARLALAKLMMIEGDVDRVREQLSALEKLSPNDTEVLRLKAALANAEGNKGKADEILEKVFDKSPSTSNILAVVRQKWAIGDKEGALDLQEKWIGENPGDLASSLILADSYNRMNKTDAAVSQYKNVLEKSDQGKNLVALNNLAWFLRDKDPEKALEHAKQAIGLAPDSPQIMDTLAVVQLKNGQIELARRTIGRVLEKDQTNPGYRYHSAMIAAAAGDKKSAIETLTRLLDEKISFGEKEEAQHLLQSMRRD